MELLALAVTGGVMVAVVFAVGVTIEILFNRRFGVRAQRPHGTEAQAHQQAVRSQLGGFGPGGGSQN
jgi:hypothetical protein